MNHYDAHEENPIKKLDDIDTDYAGLPVCPWCGENDQDWWDGTSLKHDDDDEIITCHSCEREFRRTLHIEYTFTSVRVDCDPCPKCEKKVDEGHVENCPEYGWQATTCDECKQQGGDHLWACSKKACSWCGKTHKGGPEKCEKATTDEDA